MENSEHANAWPNDGPLQGLELNPGVAESEIARLISELGIELPKDYLDVLRRANGAEGFLKPRGYLALLSASEIPSLNATAGVGEFAPGLVIIGTDGGGTGLGIDTRSGDPDMMRYVAFDLMVLDWGEIEHYGDSFFDLLNYLRSR